MVRRAAPRRMFPGGNTSRGFTSFYEFIAPVDDGYTFVLKGGPGTGKSTFMKRIAADLLAVGVDAEFHHCSADAESVDAVSFPSLGAIIIDGTAPHVVEPTDYEVGGEIVDLGVFCDRKALQRRRRRIERLRSEARDSFERAYRYLAAARIVRDDWAVANAADHDGRRVHEAAARIHAELFESGSFTTNTNADDGPSEVRRRHAFASSITPDGPRHFLQSLTAPLTRTFVVTGAPGTGRSHLMNIVADAAAARGYSVELFHCAFDPDEVDHVIIPALGAGVISSAPPHEWRADDARDRISLDNESPQQTERVTIARRTFWQLFRHAVAALHDAKTMHMQLEACYVPHVDFQALERMREKVRDRLFAVAERTLASSLSL